jgi:ABC-type transporter lipoprotein component MlaA
VLPKPAVESRDAVGDLAGHGDEPAALHGHHGRAGRRPLRDQPRAQAGDQIRNARASALDYYVFVRDAFVQHRTARIRGEYVTRGDTLDASSHVMADELYDVE